MDELLEIDSPTLAEDTLVTVAGRALKRLEALKNIKKIALQATDAYDWIDQGGKPYLQASGGEKIARLFGISWTIGEPEVELEESGHFTYTYKGVFSFMGASIEAIGTRSSKDGFFKRYGQDKVLLPPSEIDRGDVKKSAYTNLIGNGITRLLGIRNLTWEELETAGIKRSGAPRFDYQSRSQASSPPKEDASSLRDQLTQELIRHCGSDEDLMNEVLRQCSEFEKDGKRFSFSVDKIFAVKDDGTMRIKDSWIAAALGKLKKRGANHGEV